MQSEIDEIKAEVARVQEEARMRHLTHQLRYKEAKRLSKATRPCPDRCELCDQPPNGRGTNARKLHLDHDHVSGAFRGWLCRRCNGVLGYVGDDEQLLARMAVYVRTHKERPDV